MPTPPKAKIPTALFIVPDSPLPLKGLIGLLASCESKQIATAIALQQLANVQNQAVSETRVALYVETLQSLEWEQIARAISLAVRENLGTYTPLGRLFELSGAQNDEDLAEDALTWLVDYIRTYGVNRAQTGLGMREEAGEDGRVHLVPGRRPNGIPEIHELLLATLTYMAGSVQQGLEALANHPRARKGDSPEPAMDATWIADKIERKFYRAFQRAKSQRDLRAIEKQIGSEA